MKLAIFSHGKESGPNGTKITLLREVAEKYGYETVSLDYRGCKNSTERIIQLRKYIESRNVEFLLLVGSSMGGYVSTVLSTEFNLVGLFLLCPALYVMEKEYLVTEYQPLCSNIEIVHGWNDEIIPHTNSIKFGEQTKAVVNLTDDNHRLKKSYPFIVKRFDYFLNNINQSLTLTNQLAYT